MELISELFNDPIMQSMIFGPIMGVIFAVLFAGLTERPTTLVPVTVIQTREIYITRVIERRGRRSDSEEGGGILVVAGMGLLFVLWKYAIYVNEIHQYIGMVLLTALSFGLTATLLSYIKGQFTSEEWWLYIVSPVLLLFGCLYLLDLAHSTFDPKITEVAPQQVAWMELAESGASKLRSVVSPFYGLYRRQVAVLILHPNGVKTDMGEYNVSRPVEKDAELNESFDWENSGSFLYFKSP